MAEPMAGYEAARAPFRKADPLQVVWVIAWRHIKESLQNRSTYFMALFYLSLPIGLVLFTLRPALQGFLDAEGAIGIGRLMALYLLMAGMAPSTWAVGIASGAFAAEKEQGSLTPLLATPASNVSIFAGKVLGAVLPALTLAAANVAAYLLVVLLLFGSPALALMPAGIALLTVALLPAAALLGAGLSSMVSARVNTEQVANQWSSLILTVVTITLFFVVLQVGGWGPGPFGGAVAFLYLAAIAIIISSARTWRREEMMARRDA